MTYAEEAREKAKRDVRDKRQKYLRQEAQSTKSTNIRSLAAKPQGRKISQALRLLLRQLL